MTAVAFRARRIPAVELERRLALPAALQEASAILAEASARAAQMNISWVTRVASVASTARPMAGKM